MSRILVLAPEAPIEAKSDLDAPGLRCRTSAPRHRLLNEESRLHAALEGRYAIERVLMTLACLAVWNVPTAQAQQQITRSLVTNGRHDGTPPISFGQWPSMGRSTWSEEPRIYPENRLRLKHSILKPIPGRGSDPE